MDTIEFFRDALGEWRWRYIRSNGEPMADSADGCHNRADCVSAAEYLFVETEVAFTYEEG